MKNCHICNDPICGGNNATKICPKPSCQKAAKQARERVYRAKLIANRPPVKCNRCQEPFIMGVTGARTLCNKCRELMAVKQETKQCECGTRIASNKKRCYECGLEAKAQAARDEKHNTNPYWLARGEIAITGQK